MRYKALIFDFFGTISSEVSAFWFRNNLPHEDLSALKAKYNRPWDLGDLAKQVGRTPGQVREEWLALATLDAELLSMIQRLRNDYKVSICSNAAASFLRVIIDRNNIASLFEDITISSDVRSAKPEALIYRHALSRLDVQPGEAVFIDDQARYVKGAEDVGMQGIVFAGAADFKNKLSSLGISS